MIQNLRLPRWNDILVEIHRNQQRENYCKNLIRRVRGSLTHISDTVAILAERGLVEIDGSQKIKRIVLTEKGKKVAESIMIIRSEMNKN